MKVESALQWKEADQTENGSSPVNNRNTVLTVLIVDLQTNSMLTRDDRVLVAAHQQSLKSRRKLGTLVCEQNLPKYSY